MNIRRILIEESEKNRILEMHSKHKSLITEDLTINDFPICVRNAGTLSKDKNGNQSIVVPNAGGNGIQYQWYSNQVMKSYNTKDGKELKSYFYYCQCVNGKCKPKTTDTKIQHECSDKTPCKQGEQKEGGQKDSNCKNKTPYNAFTDAGLNWKEESRKWIEAKCNGTTPCISGNASTNINLRNAFCDGTWGSKKGQQDGGKQDGGEQTEACKTKCAAQPCKAGQICQQVVLWFNIDGKCKQATGPGGFTNEQECNACKCGGQGSLGEIKLPDTTKLLECATKHLKLTQLPTSCSSTISNVMPTDPTQCFNDILKGIDQNTIRDFILCLFAGGQIPKIIRELPLPGLDIPIGKIPGLEELPDFIPPVIEKPKDKPLD